MLRYMIKKGVILAGGKGTRLKPITDITNKNLVAVYDRPMIEYPLVTLKGLGVTEVLIDSGRQHAGEFLDYLGSGEDRGFDFTYRVQEQPGGLAHALQFAEPFTDHEQFIVMLGDNYIDGPVNIHVNNEKQALICLKSVHDPHRYGVAVVDGDKVLSIEEKPKNPKSNLAIVGLYVFPADVYSHTKKLKPSPRGELEITDVIAHYAQTGRLSYTMINGFYCDMGTPPSLARTIAHLTEKKLSLE